MKTDREVMQQALEALDSDNPDIQLRAAIALRGALERATHMNIYPFAGEIKMKRVIKDGQEVIEWEHVDSNEPIAYTFTPPGDEWARIDKDMNVTHLDMELCEKGPHNAYSALAVAIWNKAIDTEREACAQIAQDWDASHLETNYGACIANAIRARGVSD